MSEMVRKKWWESSHSFAYKRRLEGIQSSGATLDRKFWIAMLGFCLLAGLIWFTLGDGTVLAFGRRVPIKAVPLFVIGMFAFRAVMAREADKIRHRGDHREL